MVIEFRVMQFWSEIILVIWNHAYDSDQIALHSVQLPLLTVLKLKYYRSFLVFLYIFLISSKGLHQVHFTIVIFSPFLVTFRDYLAWTTHICFKPTQDRQLGEFRRRWYVSPFYCSRHQRMIINWLSWVRKIRKVELDVDVWIGGGEEVHLLTTVFCLLLSLLTGSLFGEMVKKWRGEGREIDLPVTQTESLTWSGKSQGMSLAIQNELNVEKKSGKCLPPSFFLFFFFFFLFSRSSQRVRHGRIWGPLCTKTSQTWPTGIKNKPCFSKM